MFFISRWNSLSHIVASSMMGSAQSFSVKQRLKVAGLFIFLLPLIIILGIADILTNGRSRNWPYFVTSQRAAALPCVVQMLWP